MSLRARLLITMVVLVAVGLAVADVATYRSLSSFLLQRLDQQLMGSELPARFALSTPDGGGFGPDHPGSSGAPAGTYAALFDPEGNRLTYKFPSGFDTTVEQTPPTLALPSGLPGSSAATSQDEVILTVNATGGLSSQYRVLASVAGQNGGTVVVAIPLSDYKATLGRLVLIELIVTGAVLALVGGLALWLVRLGLRPLEGIAETAGAIAAGDLTRRVEPADERTEVGRLGIALNSMLAQIEAAFDERRASESRLRRFIADASHELRTPLTSIRGYSELFRRGAESRPEDLATTMRRIEDEASRMGMLVDDLLLLARLDQGRPLEHEPMDLSAILSEAVETARAIEPDRRIELDCQGPSRVVGDGGRLRQVVDNLLSNARVHTPPKTPVRVALRTNGDHVLLSVADEGPGLSPEAAERAFERFYRGDTARSRQTGGAGLGLSIVSAIVHAHGGTVTATSEPTSGARFDVELPIEGGGGSSSA